MIRPPKKAGSRSKAKKGQSSKPAAAIGKPAKGGRKSGGVGGRVGGRQKKLPAVPADLLYRLLEQHYPNAHCELDYSNPYQLLVATILSAQCTDKRVNMVTPTLFARYPSAEPLAAADPDELEEIIRSTGFFRNKRKSLIGMASAVVQDHGGTVPDTLAELVKLPGVGRKTANVVLGNAFGKNEGVVVDTHVSRLSNRLGLTTQSDAVKVEQDLMGQFPRERWTMLSHLLIWHGRRLCMARKPACPDCFLANICPSSSFTPPNSDITP